MSRTTKSVAAVRLVSAALAASIASGVAFAAPHASASASHAVTAPPEQAVKYADLAQHVGDQIVVHTTFKTVRRGTLVKFSKAALTLKLKLEGEAELTVPVETIGSVALPQTPASDNGNGSAKKN
jgi:nucleoid-associated protein YgaU